MTTKTSSRGSAGNETRAGLGTPLEVVADLPRRQLALFAQSASAWYRGSEAVREVQQQAARRASEQHALAVERLGAPCDIGELLAVQADLLRFNFQQATQYWQQLASAAWKAQLEVATGAGEVLGANAEPTLEALQKAFEQTLDASKTGAVAH